MTSNEKLEELISSAFGCDIMYYQGEYEEEIKLYLELKQDLKVLDILKENAHLYVNDVNKDVKSIQINITTCNDNFNKVEGWLENEK